MASNEQLYDKRVIKRNLAKGLVDAKEHEKFLKALPDREAEAEVLAPAFDDEEDETED